MKAKSVLVAALYGLAFIGSACAAELTELPPEIGRLTPRVSFGNFR
jgi:hypothetical protein